MDTEEARRRFATSPVARLATVRPDGAPHIVPVVFASAADSIYTAVDAKPKRSRQLQRLENLRVEARCAVLVDAYDADWSRLWWVRADGQARVVEDPDPADRGMLLLSDRYPAYAESPPAGPLIIVTVLRWQGWTAS